MSRCIGTHTCKNTFINTYVHTYIHTHIHTYINTYSLRHNRRRRRVIRHKSVHPFITTCSTERGFKEQQGSSRGCNRRCWQILKNQYVLALQSRYTMVLTYENYCRIFFLNFFTRVLIFQNLLFTGVNNKRSVTSEELFLSAVPNKSTKNPNPKLTRKRYKCWQQLTAQQTWAHACVALKSLNLKLNRTLKLNRNRYKCWQQPTSQRMWARLRRSRACWAPTNLLA